MIRALALFLVVHVKVRDSKLNITEIWWERKICFKDLICFVRFWKTYFTNQMLTCYVLNASQTYLTFCSPSGFELVQSSNPVEICIICACMKLMDTNSNQLHNRESLTWRQGTLAFTTTTPTPPSLTFHPTFFLLPPTLGTTRLTSIQISPILPPSSK